MSQHSLRKVLVVGPSVPGCLLEKKDIEIVHCPIVQLQPLPPNPDMLAEASNAEAILFTSKYAVTMWRSFSVKMPKLSVCFCVGPVTQKMVHAYCPSVPIFVPDIWTQEGVAELVVQHHPMHVVWPRSTQARDVLPNVLQKHNIHLIDLPCYEPVATDIPIDLHGIDEVFFTSPSSVRTFFDRIPVLPSGISCSAIGSVTLDVLNKFLIR
jgi:uroporphyrinogen-III synthase